MCGRLPVCLVQARPPFLDHITPLLGIDQAGGHFIDGHAKCCIGQLGLAYPAGEMAGFEDSAHGLSMSLGDMVCKSMMP